MSNADLIAEARRWTTPPVQAHVPYDLLDMVGALAAALESQPAPLVADSREALVRVLNPEGHAPMEYHDRTNGSCRSCPWPIHMLDAAEIADALLASGVVSVAGDRDWATAERAWDEGQQAQFEAIVTRGVTINLPVNPYRDSEARND